MLYPLSVLESHISKTEQQLLFHLILEQQETNRLLRQLTENKQASPEEINYEEYKRPELMKLMSKSNAPQGWNKWSNTDMIKYLKGESA